MSQNQSPSGQPITGGTGLDQGHPDNTEKTHGGDMNTTAESRKAKKNRKKKEKKMKQKKLAENSSFSPAQGADEVGVGAGNYSNEVKVAETVSSTNQFPSPPAPIDAPSEAPSAVAAVESFQSEPQSHVDRDQQPAYSASVVPPTDHQSTLKSEISLNEDSVPFMNAKTENSSREPKPELIHESPTDSLPLEVSTAKPSDQLSKDIQSITEVSVPNELATVNIEENEVQAHSEASATGTVVDPVDELFGPSEESELPWINQSSPKFEQQQKESASQNSLTEEAIVSEQLDQEPASEIAHELEEALVESSMSQEPVAEQVQEQQEVDVTPAVAEVRAENLFNTSDNAPLPWEQNDEISENKVSDSFAQNENDIFSQSAQADPLPWEVNSKSDGGTENNTVIQHGQQVQEQTTESVKEDVANIFGNDHGNDDFLASLKNDNDKAKKFAFLAEDLLDDELLDDELLDDELPLNFAPQQPVQAKYQPVEQRLKSSPSQQFSNQQRNVYNPYTAHQPQAEQLQPHHLDVRKLNEQKKKSDAYDFPVDLIPKKHATKPAAPHVSQPFPFPRESSQQQEPSATTQPALNPYAQQQVNSTSAPNQYPPQRTPGISPVPNQYAPQANLPPVSSKPSASPKVKKKQSSFFEELPILQHVAPARAVRTASNSISSTAKSPIVNPVPFNRPSNPYEQSTGSNVPPPQSRYPTAAMGSGVSNVPLGPPKNNYVPAQHISSHSGPVHAATTGSPQLNMLAPAQQQQSNVANTYSPQTGGTFRPQQGISHPPVQQTSVYDSQQLSQQIPQPALSPLISQVQVGNRLSIPGISVNTNTTSATAAVISPAQPTPSSSRYAPINHRRQASSTANQYDPNSLSKFHPNQNQQDQKLIPGIQGPQNFQSHPHPSPGPHQQNTHFMPPVQHQQPFKAPSPPPAVYGGQPQPIANPENLLKRQFPLFSWSNGKKLAYLLPSNAYQNQTSLKVVDTEQVLKEKSLKEFPMISKKNVPTILKYLDACVEDITNKRYSSIDEDEILMIQLLKHKLNKNTELFNYGAVFNYHEQPKTSAFIEKPNSRQPLSKRHLFGLIFSGQKEQAVEMALQYEDYALALFISGLIDQPTWLRIVESYLTHEFTGDQNHFLPILLNILVGDPKKVVDSFRTDETKKSLALNHWKELTSAVMANRPPSLVAFFAEYAAFLVENGHVLPAQIVLMSADIPISGRILSSSLKSVLFTEIYSFTLQEQGKVVDLTEVYIHHAAWLVDYNLISEAQRYSDLALASSKASKKVDSRVKYALGYLNDQVSDFNSVDGGWFGRPKLDKVWGQLDKSLNKFISGDELKTKPKEGVFSKFSPSVSRTSSFVSIANATGNVGTGYDANNSFAPRPPVSQIPSRVGSIVPQGSHSQVPHPQVFAKPSVPALTSRPQLNRSYTPQTELPSVSQHASPAGPNSFAPSSMTGQQVSLSPKTQRTQITLSPKPKTSKYTLGQDSRQSSVTNSAFGEELSFPTHHGHGNPNALSQVAESSFQQPVLGQYLPAKAQTATIASSSVPEDSVSNNAPAPQFFENSVSPHVSNPTLHPPLSRQTSNAQELNAPPQGPPRNSSRSRSRTPRYAPVELGTTYEAPKMAEIQSQQTVHQPVQQPVEQPVEQPVQQPVFPLENSAFQPSSPGPIAPQKFVPPVELKPETFERHEIIGESTVSEGSIINGSKRNEDNIEQNEYFGDEQSRNGQSISDFGSPNVVPYDNRGTEDAEDFEVPSGLEEKEVYEHQNQVENFDIPEPQPEAFPIGQEVLEFSTEGRVPEEKTPVPSQPGISDLPKNPYAPPQLPPVKNSNPYAPRQDSASQSSKRPSTYEPKFGNGSKSPVNFSSADRFKPQYHPVESPQTTTHDVKEARYSPQQTNHSAKNAKDEEETVKSQVPPSPYPQKRPSIPRNPYAPSQAVAPAERRDSNGLPILNRSRNSSHSEMDKDGLVGDSKFNSYRAQSVGDSTTHSSSFYPTDGPKISTPQSSRFEPLRTQDSFPENNFEGLPSTKFKTYEPPTTRQNITVIDEEDEEYYDDIVDDEDDDDEDRKDDEKKSASAKKAKESKKSENSKEKEGSGWFNWLRKENNGPKVYKAHLGEQNSFYYDEDLKRWVNKNASPEELQKATAPAPPPPIIKKKPSNLSKPRSDSVSDGVSSPSASKPPSIANAPSSMSAVGPGPAVGARKTAIASDLDSLIGLTGPGSGAASARRKKRGGRGYVDVMGSMADTK